MKKLLRNLALIAFCLGTTGEMSAQKSKKGTQLIKVIGTKYDTAKAVYGYNFDFGKMANYSIGFSQVENFDNVEFETAKNLYSDFSINIGHPFRLDRNRRWLFSPKIGISTRNLSSNYFGFEWDDRGLLNTRLNLADPNFTQSVFLGTDYGDYTRNRIRLQYVTVPLEFMFVDRKIMVYDFGAEKAKNRFKAGIQVIPGYLLSAKYQYRNADKYVQVTDGDNINKFRLGAGARIGYGNYSLFANMDVSSIFYRSGVEVPNVMPLAFGIQFSYW